MLRTALVCLVLAAAPVAAGAGEAAAPRAPGGDCAAAVVHRVQRRYETVRDLSARFEQVTQPASFGTGPPAGAMRSEGEVVFAKPGKMRWSYEKPEASLVVSNGSTVWLYDPAHHEAQRFSGAEGFLSGAAIQFLLGEGQILRAFEVKALRCTPAPVLLELVPKEPATYERLQIAADPESGEIRETAVFDLVGNVTRVAFSDLRVNQDPPASSFEFLPGAGVRVVEMPPAR